MILYYGIGWIVCGVLALIHTSIFHSNVIKRKSKLNTADKIADSIFIIGGLMSLLVSIYVINIQYKRGI